MGQLWECFPCSGRGVLLLRCCQGDPRACVVLGPSEQGRGWGGGSLLQAVPEPGTGEPHCSVPAGLDNSLGQGTHPTGLEFPMEPPWDWGDVPKGAVTSPGAGWGQWKPCPGNPGVGGVPVGTSALPQRGHKTGPGRGSVSLWAQPLSPGPALVALLLSLGPGRGRGSSGMSPVQGWPWQGHLWGSGWPQDGAAGLE